MTKKVHPNASFKAFAASDKDDVSMPSLRLSKSCNSLEGSSGGGGSGGVALTVWKKSLLMNCKGFTVYDCSGNIVFRVDNYIAANRGEIALMDGDGRPLLTIRRKRLSWPGDNWQIYEGESCTNPRFTVQKQGSILVNNKTMRLAHMFGTSTTKAQRPNNKDNNKSILYTLEGSYSQRNVAVHNNKRQCVAEIKKKEAPIGVDLGGDVFKLIVTRPNDIDCALAMALVILLDQMFGSS